MLFGRDSENLLDCSISYSQQVLHSAIQHRLLAQLPCIWDECSEVALFHSLAQLLPGSILGGSGYRFVAGQWIAAFLVARRAADFASSSCYSQLSHAHANKGIAQWYRVHVVPGSIPRARGYGFCCRGGGSLVPIFGAYIWCLYLVPIYIWCLYPVPISGAYISLEPIFGAFVSSLYLEPIFGAYIFGAYIWSPLRWRAWCLLQ
jgi:hypothetical protein